MGSPLQAKAPNPFVPRTSSPNKLMKGTKIKLQLLAYWRIRILKWLFDNDENCKDVLTYNNTLHCIKRETDEDGGSYWKFWKIIGHEKAPIGNPNRKGSFHNVTIEWENGSIGPKPLGLIAKDCPVECA